MDENKRKGYRRGRMLLYSCLAVMSLGAMPESSFASSAAPSVYELQQQQSRKVKGTVIDETGQPLIGFYSGARFRYGSSDKCRWSL